MGKTSKEIWPPMEKLYEGKGGGVSGGLGDLGGS